MLYELGDYWRSVEVKGDMVVTRIGIGDDELIAVETTPNGARTLADKLEECADKAEQKS